jgi:nucleoside-diphosphate-sugar epimerase
MLVIGNGMMANAFKDAQLQGNIVVFASGVSNSLEIDAKQFEREEKLVRSTIQNNKEAYFIYFSTCSIYDNLTKEKPYVKHKLHIEQLIERHCPNYLICRVSNIVGRNGNPNTLINYLYRNILNQTDYQAWVQAERNILDVDDLVYYVNAVYELGIKNKIITIANSSNCKVIEIINEIEAYIGAKSHHQAMDFEHELKLDVSYLDDLGIRRPLHFDSPKAYIKQILNKYF